MSPRDIMAWRQAIVADIKRKMPDMTEEQRELLQMYLQSQV